jgi:hypothetical protein
MAASLPPISPQSDIGTALFYDHTSEYVVTIDLNRDGSILEDLQNYYSNQKRRYADVCVVHDDDTELAAKNRKVELNHAKSSNNIVPRQNAFAANPFESTTFKKMKLRRAN